MATSDTSYITADGLIYLADGSVVATAEATPAHLAGARPLTTATKYAAQATVAYPVVFVELDFTTETSRPWSGLGSITWDAKEWSGIGDLGKISVIEETTELRIAGITLELSGVNPTLLAVSMDRAEYRRRACAVWMGFTDSTGKSVIVDPFQVWSGRLDKMTVQDGATATMQVTSEHDIADLERVRARRYTDADQKVAYPEDEGLSFMETTQEVNEDWPNGQQ